MGFFLIPVKWIHGNPITVTVSDPALWIPRGVRTMGAPWGTFIHLTLGCSTFGTNQHSKLIGKIPDRFKSDGAGASSKSPLDGKPHIFGGFQLVMGLLQNINRFMSGKISQSKMEDDDWAHHFYDFGHPLFGLLVGGLNPSEKYESQLG